MAQDDSNAVKIAHLNHIYEQSHLRQSSISNLAQIIFKNLILLNGGAIVSIFTIMGHDGGVIIDKTDIKKAFFGFAIGIIFTLLAMGFSFFGQNTLFVDETRNGHELVFRLLGQDIPDVLKTRLADVSGFFIIATFLMSSLATCSFICGSYFALSSVSSNSITKSVLKNDIVSIPCLRLIQQVNH